MEKCPWCPAATEQVWYKMEAWDSDSWRCGNGHTWSTPKPVPTLHQPVVITDGGPWAVHDQACAVCSTNKAVLNLNLGVFEPCGECQIRGWQLRKRRRLGRHRRKRAGLIPQDYG